jgi:hypothetical protein
VISRNRRRVGPTRGRGRYRGRGAPTRAWGHARLSTRDHDRPGGAVLTKAVLFGGAAFLFINIVAAVVVLPVLVDLVAPAKELADPEAAVRARWLIIPIELASLVGAFAGALLAGWQLLDAGERAARRLRIWSAAGPVAVALLLLMAGGFAGGIVRALLDMAAVVGGTLLGARLIVRRASAASPTLP